MAAPIPNGSHLAQRLYYREAALLVYWRARKVYIRDAHTGDYPYDPCHKCRHPHPDEGRESASADYETLGLYYGYGMPETGWGGDDEEGI